MQRYGTPEFLPTGRSKINGVQMALSHSCHKSQKSHRKIMDYALKMELFDIKETEKARYRFNTYSVLEEYIYNETKRYRYRIACS